MAINKVVFGNDTLIDITDTTATASDVTSGKYFYNASGVKVQGTIAQRSSSDLSVSGAVVTVPNGYYESVASTAIPSGTLTNSQKQIGGGVGTVSFNSATGNFTVSRTTDFYPLTVTITDAGYFAEGSIQTGYFQINAASTSYQLNTEAAAVITPTESSQIAVASGKFTLGDITVAAVSSDYIGSNITQNSAADVVVAGPTVSIPSGYYGTDVSKTIASGQIGVTSQGLGLDIGVVSLDSSTGLISISRPSHIDTNNAFTKIAGYIASGAEATGSLTIFANSTSYQLSTQSAATYTPSTATQIISSGVYLTGAQTIAGDTALVASNIIQGATIFGVVGTAKAQPTLQSKTVTPSSTSQVITFDSGYDGLSSVTIEAIPISVVEHRLVLPDGLIGV